MDSPIQLLTESRIDGEVYGVSDSTGPDIAQELRDHGLQVTAQRIAVLEAVAGHPHTTPDELAEVVLHLTARREPGHDQGLVAIVLNHDHALGPRSCVRGWRI